VAIRDDLKTGQRDIWTLDTATGMARPVTDTITPETAPVWSPDGKQVAYASTRGSSAGIYRQPRDGSGSEEQLFRYTSGARLVLTDWSTDGKFMAFHSFMGFHPGLLMLLPLRGDQRAADRKAINWLREEYIAFQGRFSPDMRYLAYISNKADPEKFEIYVRPFDASKPESVPAGPVVQVSQDGAEGMICWRADGKEMYFIQPDPQTTDALVMAVDITTTPNFQAGAPRLLFKLPGPLVGNPEQLKSVSADGRRFVFAMPVPVRGG
jgi:Tol biopolymer transport system component